MQPNTTRALRKQLFAAEEEGLAKVLNNINVQTRKANEGTNLPPIK